MTIIWVILNIVESVTQSFWKWKSIIFFNMNLIFINFFKNNCVALRHSIITNISYVIYYNKKRTKRLEALCTTDHFMGMNAWYILFYYKSGNVHINNLIIIILILCLLFLFSSLLTLMPQFSPMICVLFCLSLVISYRLMEGMKSKNLVTQVACCQEWVCYSS